MKVFATPRAPDSLILGTSEPGCLFVLWPTGDAIKFLVKWRRK